MSRQQHFDGFSIDAHQARFSGTFDLDQEDLASLELDRVAFFVVAVRVEGANLKALDTGDVRRVDVLKVQDARVAADELREVCIQHIMGKGGQSVADFGLATQEQKDEESRFMATRTDRPANVSETGERIEDEGDEDNDTGGPEEYEPFVAPPEPEIEGVQVVGHINDHKEEVGVLTSSRGGDGPKVGKFNPAAFDTSGSVVEREVVGSVYGKPRKDDALRRFMEGDE